MHPGAAQQGDPSRVSAPLKSPVWWLKHMKCLSLHIHYDYLPLRDRSYTGRNIWTSSQDDTLSDRSHTRFISLSHLPYPAWEYYTG